MHTARDDAPHRVEAGSLRTRASTTRRPAATPAVVLAALTTVATLVTVASGPASASTVNGLATIADSSLHSLASGGSDTPFTVTLPAGSACTGDSAHGGYHVWSYLVKKSATLTSTTFGESGPSQGYGFFDATATYYGPVNTAIGTGQIVGIPQNFEWGPVVSEDSLLSTLLYTGGTSGVWEAGIACASGSGTLTDNWNTEITFTSSTTDPNNFVWSDVPGRSGGQPAITSATSAVFAEGSSNTFTLKATGTPTPTITESGTLPAGVSFTGGALTGDPTVTGSFPIIFTAASSNGTNATQDFTLTTGIPPAFTSAGSTTFTIGTPASFTAAATGTPAPAFSESGTLPAGVSFNNGAFAGTATAAGVFHVTLTANNGVGTAATQAFTITVPSPGFQISTTSPLPAATWNQNYSVTLKTTGAGPGATISWKKLSTLPKKLKLAKSGVLSGIPTTKTSPPPHTTVTFSVSATEKVGKVKTTVKKAFTLTIT